MTIGQIKEAACASTTSAAKFAPYINEACNKFNINTPARQLCFLAQVGHESGSLFYTEELASGAAYEGRKNLGNTQPGDGVRFKGRGLIQITGRANYKSVGDALGIDLIKNPAMLGGKNANNCTPEQLRNAALSAAWYWNSRNINAIADNIDLSKPINKGKNLENFVLITKKINGGTNGLNDRINRYCAGEKFFKAATNSKPATTENTVKNINTIAVLKKGDSGSAVIALQKALNEKGANPALLTDGDFGNGTVKAVKAFQKKEQLLADGVVGSSTFKALGFLVL